MSRFIEHYMNLDTVKHSQDDLHFRTERVYWKTSDQRLQVPFFYGYYHPDELEDMGIT